MLIGLANFFIIELHVSCPDVTLGSKKRLLCAISKPRKKYGLAGLALCLLG